MALLIFKDRFYTIIRTQLSLYLLPKRVTLLDEVVTPDSGFRMPSVLRIHDEGNGKPHEARTKEIRIVQAAQRKLKALPC